MDNELKTDNIRYYEKHAEEFFAGTVHADMSAWQKRFLKCELSEDVRPGRETERWTNIIGRKN